MLVRGLWMLSVHPEPIAAYVFHFNRGAEMAQGMSYFFQIHPTAFSPVGTSLILPGPV